MTKLFNLSSLKNLKASSIREDLKLNGSFVSWFDGINEDQPYSICVSVTPARQCWQYEVKIINLDEEKKIKSKAGQCHTIRELKEIVSQLMLFANNHNFSETKQPTITEVFEKHSITKVKEGKYTVFLNYRKKEITRICGGLKTVIARSRLIRDSLLSGRSLDDQPCSAYLSFDALENGATFKLVFSKDTVLNCKKVSQNHFEWFDSQSNCKKTLFDKGWSSARIESDDVTIMTKVVAIMDTVDRFGNCWWQDRETNKVLQEAQEKGLVSRPSVTQVFWTEKGAEACRQFIS